MRLIFRLIYTLSVSFFTVSLQAQAPLRPGMDDESKRQFSLVLAVSGTKEIFYRDGAGEHRMLPPGRTRSPIRYSYDGASPILFYDKVPGPEDTLVERTLARAEFAPSVDDMLILLHPFDETWGRVRAIVLDDSIESFAPGSVQIVNISIFPIACSINNERIGLKPTETETIQTETGTNVLNWRIAAKMDAEWRLVRAASTQFLSGMRQMIIVNVNTANPTNPGLDIFSLNDRPRTDL